MQRWAMLGRTAFRNRPSIVQPLRRQPLCLCQIQGRRQRGRSGFCGARYATSPEIALGLREDQKDQGLLRADEARADQAFDAATGRDPRGTRDMRSTLSAAGA